MAGERPKPFERRLLLEKIARDAEQGEALALRDGLGFLAYLLAMVKIEAEELRNLEDA